MGESKLAMGNCGPRRIHIHQMMGICFPSLVHFFLFFHHFPPLLHYWKGAARLGWAGLGWAGFPWSGEAEEACASRKSCVAGSMAMLCCCEVNEGGKGDELET